MDFTVLFVLIDNRTGSTIGRSRMDFSSRPKKSIVGTASDSPHTDPSASSVLRFVSFYRQWNLVKHSESMQF